MSREGTGAGPVEGPMPCVVCGLRPAAEGSVCAECSAVLKSAVPASPAPGVPPPGFHSIDDVSESPTSPQLTPPGISSRPPSSSSSSARDAGEGDRRYGAGDILDQRYTIVEEIGAGGMGLVYKALDRELEKTVALKLMRPKAMDPANVARFRRELALAQRVSHPNVCRVHDLGEVEGVLYISMEHVEGQRLDHVIVSMGHLSPRQTVALGRQLCAGLRAIHEQGIIHRDLKPSNVMVNRSGHVFIMDFGLAIRPGGDKVTSTGAVLGTFAYLSPEQARGLDIGPRSDVYAAGLILYEMLTGVSPPGDDVALPLALRDAREVCPPPSAFASDVPPELDRLVMRCLERDPGKRFATAEELEAALGKLQENWGPITGRTWSRTPSMRISVPSNPKVRWGLGAALVVALSLTAVMAARLVRRERPASVVAVLPLTNYSGDAAIDYLGAGLADVLITRLATRPELTVISGSATRKYFGDQPDPGLVARELGATLVVTGGMHRSGDRLRVTLKVMRPDGSVASVARGHAFEARVGEIFDLHTQLADALSDALQVTDGPAARTPLPPTSDAEAFAAYSEAIVLLEAVDQPDNRRRAVELLKSATTRDPKFALAHAALGGAYWIEHERSKDPAWIHLATTSALDALRLDPEQPTVRLSLGQIYAVTGRAAEAIDEANRALQLQPNSDEAHRLLGDIAGVQGRWPEAVRHYEKAIALRPGYWRHHSRLGGAHFRAGRLDLAEHAFREVIRQRPDSSWGYQMLGSVYQTLGRIDEAVALYNQALERGPSASLHANIGTIHYERGNYAAAASSYEHSRELSPTDPESHRRLAEAYAKLGRTDQANAGFAKAAQLYHDLLAVNPSDPRSLSHLAVIEAKLGAHREARKRVQAAIDLAPEAYELRYRSAVVSVLAGESQEALKALGEAIGLGYPPERARADPELAPLRTRPEFETILRVNAELKP